MKSTVPVGTGASIKRAVRRAGQGRFRYVSCPEFLKEGSAVEDFLRPRPRRRRRRRRLGRRRGGRALRAARRAARAHRHRERRDGQARLQRVPRDQDLVHQRDRQRLRGDRRRRRRGRARAWASTTASARSSCRPGSASAARASRRTSRALKQLAGNSGYHFQLLNSVIEVNELQKRRVIAKLQKHLGSLVGQGDRAARPRVQAEHRRHARGVLARARGAAAGRRRARARLRPGRRGRGAQADPGVDFAARRSRRSRAPTRVVLVTEWPEFARARLRRGGAAHARRPCSSTAATSSTRRRCARPASRTRASAARRATEEAVVQALILAGGEGTRLRPLTTTVPKPVVPLVDRPFIRFMLDWLRAHGVDDVVMSCGHLASGVRNVLGDGSAFGIRLRYVEEPRPLGTGGALKFAEPLLDERFLMLNGDVLTDIDLTAQIAQHERTGARATLALTPVEDPSAYGLVRRATAARSPSSSRSRRRTRSTPTTSPPAPTCSSARCSSCSRPTSPPRSSATSSRGWSATASTATWRRLLARHRDARALPARAPSTSSRAPCTPASPTRMGDGYAVRRATTSRTRGRIIPSALVERGCRIGEGARIGGRVVLERGVDGRRGHHDRARGRAAGRRDRRATARCAAASSPAACGSATTATSTASSVLGEGVTLGDGNVVSNGARIFPGVTLPDGATAVLMTALDREAIAAVDSTGQVARSSTCRAPARRAVARRLGGASRRSTRPAG